MSIGLGEHLRAAFKLLFLTVLICIVFATTPSSAAQWQNLTQTGRFQISIDMESVHTKQDSIMTAWLSFIPHNARLRLEASKDYAQKEYRQHMEYYEIDCLELSAALKQVDILGKSGKRIGRMLNSGSFDAIMPGSALETAAMLICPKPVHVESDENILQDSTSLKEMQSSTDQPTASEQYRKISEAKAKSDSEPANATAWIELGNAYFDADMPRESIEAYKQALIIQPDNVDVLNDQGAMFRRIGEFENALNNHERVLEIAPDNLESLYLIGYIYAIELDRIKDAITPWQRYLSIDSSSETATQIKQFIDKYSK